MLNVSTLVTRGDGLELWACASTMADISCLQFNLVHFTNARIVEARSGISEEVILSGELLAEG
jgi:hypothetical protein